MLGAAVVVGLASLQNGKTQSAVYKFCKSQRARLYVCRFHISVRCVNLFASKFLSYRCAILSSVLGFSVGKESMKQLEKKVWKLETQTNPISTVQKSVHRSCHEMFAADAFLISVVYWIDPDGHGASEDPINV